MKLVKHKTGYWELQHPRFWVLFGPGRFTCAKRGLSRPSRGGRDLVYSSKLLSIDIHVVNKGWTILH